MLFFGFLHSLEQKLTTFCSFFLIVLSMPFLQRNILVFMCRTYGIVRCWILGALSWVFNILSTQSITNPYYSQILYLWILIHTKNLFVTPTSILSALSQSLVSVWSMGKFWITWLTCSKLKLNRVIFCLVSALIL